MLMKLQLPLEGKAKNSSPPRSGNFGAGKASGLRSGNKKHKEDTVRTNNSRFVLSSGGDYRSSRSLASPVCVGLS